MTDLTVLISPTPLLSRHLSSTSTRPFSNFPFRNSAPCLPLKPFMVTLETEREREPKPKEDVIGAVVAEADNTRDSKSSQPPSLRRGRSQNRPVVDPNFLSPPIHTWRSSSSSSGRTRTKLRRTSSTHKHSRSQSAPPASRTPRSQKQEEEHQEQRQSSSSPPSNKPFVPTPLSAIVNRPPQRRSYTTPCERTTPAKRTGDLLPPPPPLLRPTTFWRKTRRSGVTAASYSPSYHLIRRSTFIAAGLDLDAPSHDLSAYCVESRIGFIVVPPDYSFL